MCFRGEFHQDTYYAFWVVFHILRFEIANIWNIDVAEGNGRWVQKTRGTEGAKDQRNSGYRGPEEQRVQRTKGTEGKEDNGNRGPVGTEDQKNSAHRGLLEQWVQRTRGIVVTDDQRNSGYRGPKEQCAQRTRGTASNNLFLQFVLL